MVDETGKGNAGVRLIEEEKIFNDQFAPAIRRNPTMAGADTR